MQNKPPYFKPIPEVIKVMVSLSLSSHPPPKITVGLQINFPVVLQIQPFTVIAVKGNSSGR
jgi:hypothetical protein